MKPTPNKPAPKRFEIRHLAFAKMYKHQLEFWKKAKATQFRKLTKVHTIYVSIYDLKEKARVKVLYEQLYGRTTYSACDVWQGTVGFMSENFTNKYNENNQTEQNLAFGCGRYHSTEDLILMDDVFDWVHGRIKIEDVRNAYDIIKAIAKEELTFS